MVSGPTPARLLERTYSYFHDHGHWPFVRTLQMEYGPGVSVRAMAAEVGRDRIFCQEGADGFCMLTLQGLATMPAAAADLEEEERLRAALRAEQEELERQRELREKVRL